MNDEEAAAGSVRSVRRILRMFELFAAVRQPMRLATIARELELPKSSCLALLTTLKAAGYLYEVSPSAGVYPTRRWLDQATAISGADPVSRKVRPIMEALHIETGETIILAQRIDDTSCYIDVIESSQNVRYSARVGERKPLHATSSGKALLAVMPATERRALLKRRALRPLTEFTIVDRELLEVDLARGRERGWYVTEGETESDVIGVAVAVGIAGECYAIVVAGPQYRVASRVTDIATALRTAAHSLEDAI